MDKKIGLFWLKDDFRFERNPALFEAIKNHNKVVVFYLYDKLKFNNQEAQKWWISNSLIYFKKKLEKINVGLQVISIESEKIFFDQLFNKKDFSIYWNRTYEPYYLKFDEYLSSNLKDKRINFKIFKGNVLNEIHEVKKGDGTPFKVFTPFWRNAEKHYLDKIPSNLKRITKTKKNINYFDKTINEENILPKKNWFNRLGKYWTPSEEEALKILKKFVKERINDYPDSRNIPFQSGTSKLSPFIKHGQIHVETIWSECTKVKKKGAHKFLTEIGWRDFNHSLINNFPHMLQSNYSKKFDNFPWEKNSKFLSAWKKGVTGYPIVDAGMRELNQTGWMHNRVRMIVGSFLVKHLLIHWKHGEKYFKNCLLDYSEANNVSGWQWVAGSGADAAPYFRIFNPILQGEKFDKEGLYVKKWIPEIKNVPNKFIHKPWEYKNALDFKIGEDYPLPIVDHETARNKALNAFKKIK
ncbi:MAG: deoxyribodipyrimidine photolyase [Candidatus Pelagibacter sp.]|nr:deoxyribodipyrimidine photolyase [Candidatus Pelagibacter sp.]